MIFPNPINARELYDKYKLYFINPKIHEITSERNALKLINNTLQLPGFFIQDFGLPDISSELMEYNDDIEVKTIQSLNDCQHKIFTEITTAVSCDNETKLFFIVGLGKTGKRYLLNTLNMSLNNKNYQRLAVAWTGIAANLLI